MRGLPWQSKKDYFNVGRLVGSLVGDLSSLRPRSLDLGQKKKIRNKQYCNKLNKDCLNGLCEKKTWKITWKQNFHRSSALSVFIILPEGLLGCWVDCERSVIFPSTYPSTHHQHTLNGQTFKSHDGYCFSGSLWRRIVVSTKPKQKNLNNSPSKIKVSSMIIQYLIDVLVYSILVFIKNFW